MTRKQFQTLAKAGMTVSLAALALTGMKKGCHNKMQHTWAGISLIGFSVWHYNLYTLKTRPALPEKSK